MFKIVTIPFDRNAKSFDEDLLNRLVVNKQIRTYRAELFYWPSTKMPINMTAHISSGRKAYILNGSETRR